MTQFGVLPSLSSITDLVSYVAVVRGSVRTTQLIQADESQHDGVKSVGELLKRPALVRDLTFVIVATNGILGQYFWRLF